MVSSSPTTLIEHGAARIQLSPNTSEWCWVVKPSVNFSHLFPFESHVVLRTGVELAALLPGTGCRGRWSDPNGPTSGFRYCCVTPAAAHRGRAEKELASGCRHYCVTPAVVHIAGPKGAHLLRAAPSPGARHRGRTPRARILSLPILRRRVLGFSSWFRKGPYARVAEWQTRWLQVPVPFLGVEVQLLSRAQSSWVVNEDETPRQHRDHYWFWCGVHEPDRCRCTLKSSENHSRTMHWRCRLLASASFAHRRTPLQDAP